ncbi:MAG: polysaccharide deacetylase family protein [Gemmatimonadetes bacterium]|nr:polysaccharide deacetylase family protein [Gemmatimonadota bacterium]
MIQTLGVASGLLGMLKGTKHTGLTALKVSGGFDACARSEWRRQRLAILCYHGVSLSDEHQWDPALYVSEEALRGRFELLRRMGCPILPLAEAVERLDQGTLPQQAVSITFDDGSYDFFHKAVPLLEEFGFPATVYLTTYYVDTQLPVFDVALAYTVWKADRIEAIHDVKDITPYLKDISLHRHDPYGAVSGIREYAHTQGLSARDRDDLLTRIAQAVGVDLEGLRSRRMLSLMSPGEVASLPDLVDVQLHTHRHRSPDTRDAFVREIEDNRRRIRELLGPEHILEHFCYPSGVYDRVQLPWLADLGVRSATTVESGLAGPEHPPLLLPRVIDTMNLSDLEFEAWITGAWPRMLAAARLRR